MIDMATKEPSQRFRIRPVFVSTKGDWPFLRKCFKLRTGFTSSRICHYCDATDSFLQIYLEIFPLLAFHVVFRKLRNGGMLAHKETSDNFRLITRVLTHTGQEGRQYGT